MICREIFGAGFFLGSIFVVWFQMMYDLCSKEDKGFYRKGDGN